MIFSRAFWRAARERAVSAGAYAALMAWGGGVLPDVSLPWWTVPVAFAGGAALSVLKALAASRTGDGGPSLTNAERLQP